MNVCRAARFLVLLVATSVSPALAQTAGTRDVARVRLPQKWALLIGVNDYSEVTDLEYCGADIKALRTKLIDAGFAPDHVFVMTDGSEAKYLPSKGNIERQLELIPQMTEPDDLLVLAFSGHGVHLEATSYLCPSDANLERPQETLVSLDTVYETLKRCPARQKLLLVDACRNTPVPAGNKQIDGAKTMEAFAGSLDAPEGVLVLSSCKPGQISVEDPQFRHGVFMYFFLKGLEGEADRVMGNRDGAISLLELYRYASDQTKIHVVRTRNIAQTPALKGEFALDYDIARVPEAITDPTDAPRPAPSATAASQPESPQPAAAEGEPNATPAMPPALGSSESSPAPDPATRALIDGLRKSAATHQASGNMAQAIEAYTSAIRLDPADKSLYLRRGALHKINGDLVAAVADYQVAGVLLQLTVTADSSPLQAGQNQTGVVLKGQVVNVREWKKLGAYDWLYVANVGGDASLSGWLLASAVEPPKPAATPAAAPAVAVSPAPSPATSTRSVPAADRSPSRNYGNMPDYDRYPSNRPSSSRPSGQRPPSIWQTPEWESPREIREKRARGELR